MDDDVRRVIEAGTLAPSGENAQPWHFSVRKLDQEETEILVSVSKDRDQSLYGWGDRASYVAIGALLENMRIAAPGNGLSLEIVLLPDGAGSSIAARVVCKRVAGRTPDPLADSIRRRITNRKPYRTEPLTSDERNALMGAARLGGYGALRLAETQEEIRTLAAVGSGNERLMLNNETLHAFFFSHVNWTRQEDAEKKVGFFIDTLELPSPARAGFRLMSSWGRARVLNKLLGFYKVASHQNAQNYAHASAVGIVLVPHESSEDALRSGMTVERIWLEATRLGLYMQPMTGILYFALKLRAGDRDGFSGTERRFIESQYAKIEEAFGFFEETSYFMFRIGHAEPPTAQAIRFSVDEVVSVSR